MSELKFLPNFSDESEIRNHVEGTLEDEVTLPMVKWLRLKIAYHISKLGTSKFLTPNGI
jgi:hypothetical protein